MDIQAKIRIGAIVTTLAALLTVSINCANNRNGEREERSKANIALVDRCMVLASGEDGVLNFEEGVKLARGLGYNKAILKDERIVLEHFYDRDPVLYIGYTGSRNNFRDSITVTPDLMNLFIKNRDSKP